ncbi:MAG: hypothetical protein M1812_002448 [Candelaria pacifica]|nr:MAG: hypothetical protein M1812_002448 [Candelaria pacifica]
MPSAVRQTKRPFQPSITSYFARADRDDSYLHPSPLLPFPGTPTPAPTLPVPVQSSLLNVGMRVRKSVPEGYKTAAYCALGSSTGDSSSSKGPSNSGGVYNSRGRGFAELTPYCGILRTGGYACQTGSGGCNTTHDLATFEFDLDDYGFPCSSQESNISTISSDSLPAALPYSSANKRRFEDDEEDLLNSTNLIWEEEEQYLNSLSPRSYPVSHTSMPNLDMIRPIALPKTRRKWQLGSLGKETLVRGRENQISGMQDFDEVDFLKPPEWVDREIEMSGI